jgi:hypothetical protein
MTSFTAMLDEYLDAKTELEAAKVRNPARNYYGQHSWEDVIRREQERYDAAATALNGLVERLLRAEHSVRTRDTVQPLPTGFP